jgi:hypothetical protein
MNPNRDRLICLIEGQIDDYPGVINDGVALFDDKRMRYITLLLAGLSLDVHLTTNPR